MLVEHEDPRARKEGRVDFKRRILSRCADQNEDPALHMRQKCVLLRLIPTMYLIYEEDGTFTNLARCLSCFDHFAQFLDAASDG